ncbi:nitrate assimilation regulatory nira [Fusarium heterosporum]|uniref:Nitrate assimilation regulatory nira n=1 Tax=Fusarium heterosporum TaxID=42747 RepID=A0A8H5WSP1_FUSHE|nr:nitrate assimilation regulatory nira [Fusarium heterosporum]
MAPQRLRALQPAEPSPSSTASPSSSASQPLPPLNRKAGYVPACEPCRKRKKKHAGCDRRRPDCSTCTERGLECFYLNVTSESPIIASQLERLASLNNDPRAILDLLTTLPYFDALELFNALREMPRGMETSASIIEAPSSSPQHNLIGSLLPASNLLEQELMVRHPIAYPILLPVVIGSPSFEDLLTSRRPGMTATQVLRDTTSPSSADMMLSDDEELGDDDTLVEFCRRLPHLTQSHVEYLQKVDLTLWMDLLIPNQTAVRVIALYLNNDYPVLPLFHADLFLHDLSQNRPYFCSALLISALLGWACQACTCIDPEIASWSVFLFQDAQTRWDQLDLEKSITITSLSALQFMCMTAIAHGRDDLGLNFLRKGLELGQKMGILNVELDAQSLPPQWLNGYPDWRGAASYAAWGAYNLASMVSLHYHTVEVITAPRLELPGDIDQMLAAEEDRSSTPSVISEAFKASCKLWMIFSPIAKSYYREGIAISGPASVEFAEKVYRQLLAWANELPLELTRRPGSSHSVYMLHIFFHAIVTDLFRPLLHTESWSAPLRTFKADNATPQTVYSASTRQMKRLLLSHRSEMGPETLSIFWQSCVIYVANAVIHGGDDQNERKFFVQLCLTGLQELFLSYQVSGIIVKGIAGMAIRSGALDKSQVAGTRHRLEETARRYETDKAEKVGGKLADDFDSIGGAMD